MPVYIDNSRITNLGVFYDATAWPTADIDLAIDIAEEMWNRETGTTWTYQTQTSRPFYVDQQNWLVHDRWGSWIFGTQSIGDITEDGVSLSPGEISQFKIDQWGHIRKGTLAAGTEYVFTVTAGATAVPPEDVKWAIELLTVHILLNQSDQSRINDRALSLTNSNGMTILSQAGKHGPTPLPQVNSLIRKLGKRSMW